MGRDGDLTLVNVALLSHYPCGLGPEEPVKQWKLHSLVPIIQMEALPFHFPMGVSVGTFPLLPEGNWEEGSSGRGAYPRSLLSYCWPCSTHDLVSFAVSSQAWWQLHAIITYSLSTCILNFNPEPGLYQKQVSLLLPGLFEAIHLVGEHLLSFVV